MKKLSELYKKPLREVLENMELAEMKCHTTDDGEICSVELKYVEKSDSKNSEKGDSRTWQ